MKGTDRTVHEAIRYKADLSKWGFEQGQFYNLHVTPLSGTAWAVFEPEPPEPRPTSGGYKSFKTLSELLDSFEFTIDFSKPSI